jgi:hypothetical protein
MEYTLYNEALNFWNSENEKIKVVIFSLKDCPTCDDFLPHVLEPILINEYAEHFDVVKVDLAEDSITFPPIGAPTIYFSIPNTQEKMPLVRVGGIPESFLRKDLDTMIKIKDQGWTVAQALADTQYTEVSAWIQRQIRL